MEESEKRRVRLRAMRQAAEEQQQEAEGSSAGAVEQPDLPAPLLRESPEDSVATFDYYTDPVAAYAGAKRKGWQRRPAQRMETQRVVVPQPPSAAAGEAAPHVPLSRNPSGQYGGWLPGGSRGRGLGGRGGGGGGGGYGGRHGRGRGDGPVSAEDCPEMFYNMSMVENPWRHLGG